MRIFGGAPPTQNPDSALRLPAAKRMTAPNAVRLSTITEGSNTGSNAPSRSNLLNASDSNLRPVHERQASGGAASSINTQRTAPPRYSWIPEVPEDTYEDLTAPVEGEKLAQLRRSGGHIKNGRARGGWGRLWLVSGVVLLVVVGLAVGLGVGLTIGKKNKNSSSDSEATGQTADTAPAQEFPLGEYSFVTALHTVDTNCTSNPSTWRCYPYTTYDPSNSGATNTSSMAIWNWVISNTSHAYASNRTSTQLPESGVPANLSISSTSNPFSITFSEQALTYYPGLNNNATAERYEFNFQQSKTVIPSTSITSSGAGSECFFNSTTFTGVLYLDATRDYPDASLADSTAVGGYEQWPFAIEIRQESPGGESIPACYEMANGQVEDRILTAVTPEPESSRCVCDYRNYG